jgi:hypothetical protein
VAGFVESSARARSCSGCHTAAARVAPIAFQRFDNAARACAESRSPGSSHESGAWPPLRQMPPSAQMRAEVILGSASQPTNARRVASKPL